MKLFYQLFFSLLLGLIVIVSIDEYFSYKEEVFQFEEDLIRNAIQDGRSISGMISHVWQESGQERALELLEDASVEGQLKVAWFWFDDLKSDTLVRQRVEIKSLLHYQQPLSIKVGEDTPAANIVTYVPISIADERAGGVVIEQSLASLKNYRHRMLIRALFITAVLAVFFGAILYIFINWKIRRPIEQLMVHTRNIGDGDFGPGPIVTENNELGKLSETINDMCSRLVISQEKIKFEYESRLQSIEQLRHTEQLSNLGILSAGIAHEIGTPLNVIEGRAKMIAAEELSDQEKRHNGEIIYKQCEKITATIRQLLDYSRRPKQQMGMANIKFLIKQVFQLLYPMARKQAVSMNLSVDENIKTTIQADESQLQQVFVNLLMNSIQAMPEGGHIDITLSSHLEKNNTYLRVQIYDEGGGIEPDNLENIFNPFFTTKSIGKGTGLGLSIAYEIVEEHDGWITVENSGKGSCFSIYLPNEGEKECGE